MTALVTFAAALAIAGASPAAPADAAREVLASPSMRFCRDGSFPLTSEEFAWCELLPADGGACPALRTSCKHGPRAELVGRRSVPRLELPSLGSFGVALLWTLFAVALAALVALVARTARRGLAARARPAAAPAPTAARATVEAAAARAEHDVDRLLDRARAAGDRSAWGEALANLHAALLRRLEADGVVNVHAASTNGEYLRQVRAQAPERAVRVAPVVRTIEAVQFGATPTEATWWQRLYTEVEAIARRTIPVLLTLVLASSCNLSDRGDWDRSPSGVRGIVRFLSLAGIDTHERIASLADLGSDEEDAPAQLVVLPDAELDEADWKHLARWLDDEEGRLIVVGKRTLPPWITVEHAAGAPVAPLLPTKEIELAKPISGHVPGRAQVRGANADHATLVARGATAYALRVPRDTGELFVVADDSLFQNASLAVAGNADLLVALLADAGGRTEFVGELTGLVSPNPVASVGRARLAPFVLQLGIVIALLFVARGAAFGRLVDPPRSDRRAFVEHVQALGTQYARARAVRHAAAAYATYVIERLRERVGGSAPGITSLAAAVAERTGRPVGEVARVVLAAREPEEGTNRAQEDAAARASLRELAALLEACNPAPQSRKR